jgi:hypothetical protein
MPAQQPANELLQETNEPASMYPHQTEFEYGQTVVAQKTEGCPIRAGIRRGQDKFQAKKNPKQLMEAWDLKMHKPWW